MIEAGWDEQADRLLIIPTGFIEGDSPFSANLGFVVKDVAAAKDSINWYAQHGYQQIKLYNSIRRRWLTNSMNVTN